ncbi:uncharacterized protein LOC129582295 [Paramacrobiotus metropolitanus]|uniref:uncharacterized protein LOC129582295 n=1 Tax=Paramacrobiotus metropolitanus TaxID=2943436 RepID=UPI002445A8A6|nr:uncharacterized protein LOC129582295 [Paramacrobiotus metropolitanus]
MDASLPGGSRVDQTPGDGKSWTTTFKELGMQATQNFDPLKQFKAHFCGFAFYNGQPNRQVELHHYVAAINDDVFQCAVFDSPDAGARLIGIEYVVTEKIFCMLDEEEQKFWHNHAFDVKSGSFIAPGLPWALEKKVMADMMPTYGKTFILWQTDRGDKLPLGPPQLMMTANADGQWQDKLFRTREQRRGAHYKFADILTNREEMVMPPIHPGCDQWATDLLALQCKMERVISEDYKD